MTSNNWVNNEANSSMDPVSREDLLPVDLLRVGSAMDLCHEKRQVGLGCMELEE